MCRERDRHTVVVTTEQGGPLPPTAGIGGRSKEVVTVTVPKLLIGVVVLSVVAAFVPAALGGERPDDRAGLRGVGSVAPAVVVRLDDRAGPLGVGSVAPVVVEAPVASTGIDWADPLVIAGLTALAAVAAMAVAYGVVHHRHGGAGKTGGPGRTAVTH
jgi:hypothetical protein